MWKFSVLVEIWFKKRDQRKRKRKHRKLLKIKFFSKIQSAIMLGLKNLFKKNPLKQNKHRESLRIF